MRFVDYSKKIKEREMTKPLWLQSDLGFLNLKIGGMVKRARLQEGLTQAQLAQRVGTKQSSIARLESGKVSPSISFLNEVAKALNTYLIEPRFNSVEHFYSSEASCNFSSSGVFQNPQNVGNYVSIHSEENLNFND